MPTVTRATAIATEDDPVFFIRLTSPLRLVVYFCLNTLPSFITKNRILQRVNVGQRIAAHAHNVGIGSGASRQFAFHLQQIGCL